MRAKVDLPPDRLLAIGLRRPHDPVRRGLPQEAPWLQFIQSREAAVELWVRRSDIVALRRPEGVIGAMLWKWFGPYPPPDIQRQWQWAGNFQRRRVWVDFGHAAADGGQVWIAASWLNAKAQVGPISRPLHVRVAGLTHAPQIVRLGAASPPQPMRNAA